MGHYRSTNSNETLKEMLLNINVLFDLLGDSFSLRGSLEELIKERTDINDGADLLIVLMFLAADSCYQSVINL